MRKLVCMFLVKSVRTDRIWMKFGMNYHTLDQHLAKFYLDVRAELRAKASNCLYSQTKNEWHIYCHRNKSLFKFDIFL